MRSCVVCRTTREKRALVRVVRGLDGMLRLDPGGRASGRGAYLCRDGTCLTAAGGRGALRHALGVDAPPDLLAALAGFAGDAARSAGTR